MIRPKHQHSLSSTCQLCILIFFVSLIPGWALAQEHRQSLIVTGVDKSDVLYLRAAPDARAEIVGAIPPNGKGIQAVEDREKKGWIRVQYRALKGWANARFLTSSSLATEEMPLEVNLKCAGEEPAWTLEMTGTTFRLAHPWDAQPTTWSRKSAQPPDNRFQPWTIEAIGADKKPAAVAIVTRTFNCGGGMSDGTYPYEILVHRMGGETIVGCCGDALGK